MLTGGPGADPARGNAERRKAPIVVGERGAEHAAKGRTNVGVGEKASMLRIGRYGAARVEDLGPPGTRPEEAESLLSIRETTDGVDEGTGLGDAAAQEKLTPIRTSFCFAEQQKAGGSIPTASREAVRPE